jgi:hypothetical protein
MPIWDFGPIALSALCSRPEHHLPIFHAWQIPVSFSLSFTHTLSFLPSINNRFYAICPVEVAAQPKKKKRTWYHRPTESYSFDTSFGFLSSWIRARSVLRKPVGFFPSFFFFAAIYFLIAWSHMHCTEFTIDQKPQMILWGEWKKSPIGRGQYLII